MLKDLIIFILVAYIVSRILRFLLPVFRITSAANSHLKNMQEQMQAQMRENEQSRQQATQGTFQNGQRQSRPKEGDYIDYEEV